VAAPTPEPAPAVAPEPTPEPEPEAAPDPAGEPVRVRVPAIDVDADLVELGLEPDGAMEVPDFGLAGWYAEGPKPGHRGPAAIAAHVDSRAGPDVFFRLQELEEGDEVHVGYDSGDEVTFVVTASERVPKDDLPADRIWPVTSDRLLTLITCGGEFDREIRHYRDNIIVYTEPLAS
jgi:LPXTG-site transpeptidase (sortase) family protein